MCNIRLFNQVKQSYISQLTFCNLHFVTYICTCMQRIDNPFLVKGYITPQYFCNRLQETQMFIDAAINGRDITLFSLRRMGKSGLLDNVGHHLKTKHKYIYIYSDIYNTESLEQLVSELATNVIQQLFPKQNMFEKVSRFFKHISPQVSFDQLTGSPQVQLHFNSNSDAYQSLEELFEMVNQHPKPVYWAWDEFQQIMQYEDHMNVLKQLRYLVQRSTNIRFAFSGSHTNMLISIFNNAKQPFYKSTQLVELKEIKKSDYSKFITKHFKKVKKSIEKDAIDKILEYTLVHTWYTQTLCNRLYQTYDAVSVDNVKKMFNIILEESEITFYRFRQLFSKGQWDVLKAIGREEKVIQPTSSKFIKKHDLPGSASILRALEKLVKDEFVVEIFEKDKKHYRLNDVFLMRWLQWKY